MTKLGVRITSLPFLVFLAKFTYHRYNGYCFIIHMLVKYCDILKQRRVLLVRAVSITYMKHLLEDNKTVMWDPDNTVVVKDSVERSFVKFIVTHLNSDIVKRKVIVITKTFCKDNEALLTHNLHCNLNGVTSCFFRDYTNNVFEYAEEVELSLINSSADWSNFVVDTCLRNYFKKPKLLYLGDIIAVSLKEYGIEAFYLTEKINNVELNLYFKCKNIIFRGKSSDGYLCAANKTVLKQTANIQSFVPNLFYETSVNSTSLQPHPDALDYYFKSIKQAIIPFVKLDRQDFLPIFLIEGRKGSGKSLLIKNIALHFGMHLYTVNSFDVSANVYAQNEIKLRNLFSSAKMIAPSILEILNFENFGKNNEDEYDERLISSFADEVGTFFMGNKFPAILFCSSNEKNIPGNLRRIFLKIFEIKAPDHRGRESLLRWITATEGVKIDEIDINKLANRTHGFLLEDLRALVHYAVTDSAKNNSGSDYVPDSYFLKALDFMQANYNESVGAPKVPQVKWSDVGGLTEVKEEIIKTIKLPLKYPHLLKSNGLKRSGILLFGPPGTGKTLLAKAVATECGLCFLSVKGPELLNMYVGQSEQNVREVFERAREASPCIIFFDELDSLAPNRGGSGDSGGVMDRIVSQLLAEMDGLNQTGTVFIIGATNRPDLIDPALLRPGRFDKLLYVGPCTDRDSKLAVLKALTKRFYLESSRLLEEIVEICPENFSGADYYGVCSMAWMSAVSRLISDVENENRDEQTKTKLTPTLENIIVGAEDFMIAVKNIKPSITKEDLDYFHSLQSKFR